MMSEEKKLTDEQIDEFRELYGGEVKYPEHHARAHIQWLIAHIDAMKAEHAELIEAADLLIEEKDEQLRAFRSIEEELNRQNAKWGDQSGHPMPVWYAILGEEVGEVAQAILEQKPDECLKELIQVAAVAMQMIQAIQTRQKSEDKLTKL